MPRKKLTTSAIPHLAPGEWYDTMRAGPDPARRENRRTWDFRFHAGGATNASRSAIFRRGARAARDAARR